MKTEIDYSSHSYDDIAAPDQEEQSSFKMVRLTGFIMLLFPSLIIILINENYPPNLCTEHILSLAAHLSEIKMQICHTEKSRSSSPSYNVFANQVESWDDEAAANADGDDHGLVLQQQIAKERELATKVVVKMIKIGVCGATQCYP